MKRVLERFNMKNVKPVSTLLTNHFKLNKRSCPTSDEEKKEMIAIRYSSAIESLMYIMVCTWLNIVHVVGVVCRFFSNLDRDHWEDAKWIKGS